MDEQAIRTQLANEQTEFLVNNARWYRLDIPTKWACIELDWIPGHEFDAVVVDREALLDTLTAFIANRLPESTSLTRITIAG